LIGPGDSLHVRDVNGWSVFDSAGIFARRMSNQAMAYSANSMRFMGGDLLVAASREQPPLFYFRMVNRRAEVVRSFGPTTPEDQSRRPYGTMDRVIGRNNDSTFWAAARPGSSDMYQLEEWTVQGERLRTIRRVVPWFPDPNHVVRKADSTEEVPPPEFGQVHVDSTGFLLVYLHIPTKLYKPNALPNIDRTGWFENRYEVIDPDRGIVLVSGMLTQQVSARFFDASHTGFRRMQKESGEAYHEIVVYRLVQREQREKECEAAG
jgi:hypothetical protein